MTSECGITGAGGKGLFGAVLDDSLNESQDFFFDDFYLGMNVGENSRLNIVPFKSSAGNGFALGAAPEKGGSILI